MLSKDRLDKKFSENPFISISDALYQLLYDDIVRLRITPGSRLSLSKIAEELNISRSPVRSAVDRLVDNNLLHNDQSKILVVSHMTVDESNKLYEARVALEGYAVFLAAMNITDKQLQKLEKLVNKYTEICRNEYVDSEEYATYDHQFHSLIIEASCNKYIKHMYESIEGRLLHYRYALLPELGDSRLKPILQRAEKRHRTIYHAIQFGFTDSARTAMIADIEGMKDAFKEWQRI